VPDVRVSMELPTGRTQSVELPDDVPVGELIPEAITALKLPTTGPDGRPVSYKLNCKRLGRDIREEETLSGAGVTAGDLIRVAPDVTAGRSP